MLKTIKHLIITGSLLALTGCVCLNPAHKKINPPPVLAPPPALKTDRLEKNVNDLDEALKKAKSKADRIRILTEQLKFDK